MQEGQEGPTKPKKEPGKKSSNITRDESIGEDTIKKLIRKLGGELPQDEEEGTSEE